MIILFYSVILLYRGEDMDKRELKILREYKVIKRNDLIQKSKYNLTATEQKIVWFLISKIKYEDKDLNTYIIEINEFCRICGIQESNGGNYKTLKTALKTLSDKSFWMPTIKGTIPLIRWIETPEIIPRDGTIKVTLNKNLKPYLVDIQGAYSTLEFKVALAMSGMYSIRLYELLKSYTGMKKCDFKIDELAKKVGAMNYDKIGKPISEKYKPYDFKRFVIEKSLKEINEFSELNVDYTMGKTGNRYTHVYFKISEKVGSDWYESTIAADKVIAKRGTS